MKQDAVTFQIDYLPKMTNVKHGRHWSNYYKERQNVESWVFAELPKEWRNLNLESAHVTITRHSSRQPDYDGLVSAGKSIVDSLVTLGVIVDDDPAHLSRSYAWEKAPRGAGFVRVEVRRRG